MENHGQNPIRGLSPAVRDTVEQMLLGGESYFEIAAYLAGHGLQTGVESISEYAATLNANVATLRKAQNDLRKMLAEVERCPALETSDAVLRLAMGHVLRALTESDGADTASIERAIHAAVGLINAAAYKKRADFTAQLSVERGLDSVGGMLFTALARERPALYNEVYAFLKEKKAALRRERGESACPRSLKTSGG